MLYYTAAAQKNSAEDQFNEAKWNEIRTDKHFIEFFNTHPEYPHDTYPQFADSLLKAQEHKAQEYYESVLCSYGIQIEHYNEPSALFLLRTIGCP